jgi:hypothetical protein
LPARRSAFARANGAAVGFADGVAAWLEGETSKVSAMAAARTNGKRGIVVPVSLAAPRSFVEIDAPGSLWYPVSVVGRTGVLILLRSAHIERGVIHGSSRCTG